MRLLNRYGAVKAYIGPACFGMSKAQIRRFAREYRQIDKRLPGDDNVHKREGARRGALQYVLGDIALRRASENLATTLDQIDQMAEAGRWDELPALRQLAEAQRELALQVVLLQLVDLPDGGRNVIRALDRVADIFESRRDTKE